MRPKVFVVCCHRAPGTKGGTLVGILCSCLESEGIEYTCVDLSATDFSPTLSSADFKPEFRSENFRKSQQAASEAGGFCKEIEFHQVALQNCSDLILAYPLRFFSMPAQLKGWMERVLARGFAYGKGMEYGTGGMAGKQAHALITAAAPQVDYQLSGKHLPFSDIERITLALPLEYVGFKFVGAKTIFGVGTISESDFQSCAQRACAEVVGSIKQRVGE